jgi:thioester reductase-like protein
MKILVTGGGGFLSSYKEAALMMRMQFPTLLRDVMP